MDTQKIDVLAVMDGAWRVFASQSIRSGDGADYQADAVKEARAAVAELIEAATDVDRLVNSYEATLTERLNGYNRMAAAIARIGGAA